jgi:hypothetical protein
VGWLQTQKCPGQVAHYSGGVLVTGWGLLVRNTSGQLWADKEKHSKMEQKESKWKGLGLGSVTRQEEWGKEKERQTVVDLITGGNSKLQSSYTGFGTSVNSKPNCDLHVNWVSLPQLADVLRAGTDLTGWWPGGAGAGLEIVSCMPLKILIELMAKYTSL